MAIININANLNGGDDTTPDNELFYRIYGDVDAYASPIHTTGTAIADADVTVTGDVVIITGVDGSTNTEFKIAAVDGAGNEGVLSDAHSSDITLFSSTFDGTVVDTTVDWTYEENAQPTLTTLTQDDELQCNIVSAGSTANYMNVLYAKPAEAKPPRDGFNVLIFDMQLDANSTVFEVGFCRYGYWSNNDANRTVISGSWTDATRIGCNIIDDSGAISEKIDLDVTQKTTYKLIVDLTNSQAMYYYWGGSSWTLLHTATGIVSVEDVVMIPYVGFKYHSSYSTAPATNIVDNFYVLDSDISTQYPI